MSQHIKLSRLTQLAASIALVAGGSAFVTAAHAAAPAAGTQISNIAAATYTDANGTSKSVTSNEVKTTVLQVASFTLVDDRTATANPGNNVTLSHTLTNTGNAADTFDIDVAQIASPADDFDLSNVNVYIDRNNDGTPDNNTPITTVTLAPGESVGLIVVSTVPVSETAGETAQYTLTATSQFDNTVTDLDTDTVTVANGAVMQIQKSASVTSVDDNGNIVYTLTYRNTGNAAADNVVIEDTLDLTKVTYTAESGIWSGSATALTDAAGGDPTGITYQYDSGTGQIQAVIANVAANSTGTIRFTVTANASNREKITNVATVYDDDDNDPTNPAPVDPTESNQTVVDRTPTYTGSINDNVNDDYADADADVNDPTLDDQIIQNGAQGTPVVFGDNVGSLDAGADTIVIHNTGNTEEVYNVTVDRTDLPAGSIVNLYKADGITPLTDTNGDGIVDTGPVLPGEEVQIVTKVTLPAGFTEVDPNETTDVVLTVDPVNNPDPAANDTLTLVINDVTEASVDLTDGDGTNETANGPIAGSSGDDTGDPVESQTVEPGESVTFPMAVTNNGANNDNFNITAPVLPNGWTVEYFVDANNDGVADNNTPVTNTGNIAPGATVDLVAVVTVPEGTPPSQNNDVRVQVESPLTGLSDIIAYDVTVDDERELVLEFDQNGQVAPGGTITYIHTLTNNGNITEGDDVGELPFTTTNSQPGWTSNVYVDLNNNGEADDNELVTDGDLSSVLVDGLAPGEEARIIVKVEAPTSAVPGLTNVTVFEIDPLDPPLNANSDDVLAPISNTDTTIVNDGQVRLVKEQAVDADCDGGETVFTINNVSAEPGQCVQYRITATNEGNVDVTDVVISDTTPAYTTFVANASSPVRTNADGGVEPADGATGNVTATKTPLAPNTTTVLEFVVKIND